MKNRNLAHTILKALEKQYLCASEINQKLKMNQIDFEDRKFFPTLSQLQLNNLLCYNWIKDKNDFPVKYYHITKNGLKLIQSTCKI